MFCLISFRKIDYLLNSCLDPRERAYTINHPQEGMLLIIGILLLMGILFIYSVILNLTPRAVTSKKHFKAKQIFSVQQITLVK